MKKKLTKRAIDALEPQAKDLFVWDTDLSGFGLKITPSGTRVYILQYRVAGIGVRRYTVGKHGTWTPDTARKEAVRLLGLVASGKDPAEAKQHGKDGLTFSAFSERYLKEYAVPHKKPRSAEEDRRNLHNHATPAIGSRRIDKVTRTDVAKLHHALRETPIAANRVLVLLHTIFSLAEAWGQRPDGSNPCKHIKKYKEQKRERFLSEQELARLGKVLAEKESTVHPSVTGAIRLLIFTGARLNEILTLQWNMVDLEQWSIRLPDSKTGAKTIHLNPPALSVLSKLPRIEGNPYVLPGVRAGSHMSNIHHAWFNIRDESKLPDLRIHDLRHSFASVGAGSGLGLPVIGALLGHTQAATTQRYAHLSADPLKQASDLIGEKIQAAMDSKPKAPIVPLKRNRRIKKGG